MDKQNEHIVRSYEEELSLLNNKIAKMGGLAEQVLGAVDRGARRRDPELAAATIRRTRRSMRSSARSRSRRR